MGGGRAMRKTMTPVARCLRSRCDQRQAPPLAKPSKEASRGFLLGRQVVLGGYIADFAYFDVRLVVEVDGGTHSTNEEIARDAERSARARFRHSAPRQRRRVSQSRRRSEDDLFKADGTEVAHRGFRDLGLARPPIP